MLKSASSWTYIPPPPPLIFLCMSAQSEGVPVLTIA